MATSWTAQQEQAISTRNCDLLVAAAAGSGKTAVLVERVIRRVVNEGQEIERMLVVTFTNAAAAEMRQRIGAAIAKALEEEQEKEQRNEQTMVHLQNQMAFLQRADIKTIHAFCLQLLREQYHILGIDPAARTADPAEIKLLQKEVLGDLFEELYEAEENSWFLNLLEIFGQSTKDDSLKKLVLETYQFALSAPYPEQLLDTMAETYHLSEGKGIEDCVWFSLIRQSVQDGAEYAMQQLKRAAYEIAGLSDFAAYQERITAEQEGIQYFLQALAEEPPSYGKWSLALKAIDFSRLPAYRGEDKDLAERFKELRNEAKDTIKKLGEAYFNHDGEMQANLIRQLYPAALALAKLTKLFMKAFAQAKQEKNIIDFTDYEHFALRLLVDENGQPTEIAKEMRSRYDEIMIDEYQDSNLVQELLLSAVSGESIGENNRFMVGDVKQSIYRFRQAMPELFNEKYKIYPAEEGEKTRKIVLSQNFRSRKNILDGVNFLCRQIMQPQFGDIAYDAEAALYAGAKFAECEGLHGGANEIILIHTKEQEDSELPEELLELDRRQVEAAAIAARIKELIASGYQIWDKKEERYRTVSYGDIAILFRSMKNWSTVLEEVFGREGIPYYAEASEGYFAMPEVETALHLLRLVDNPRQDIPLLSVLYSPIYGLDADELMEIRLHGGKGLYYDCIQSYVENGREETLRKKLTAFLEMLQHWRKLAREVSLQELLRILYRETGYFDYLGMTAGGALRQANLQMLMEKAEQFEKGSRKGAFYFLRYVEDLQEAEAEPSSAKLQGEGRNLVRVMTIHKSKGLEFPVVFVSDMGKHFNNMDVKGAVIFHQKWGCGMDMTDPVKRVTYRTLAKRALAEVTKLENLSEETRVLYVALTRAKEKLILTGAVKDAEKAFYKWEQTADSRKETLPVFRLRRGLCYLDWVMPAFMRHPEAYHLDWSESRHTLFGKEQSEWSFCCLTRETVLSGISEEQKKAEEQESFFAAWEEKTEPTPEQEAVFRILGWKYPQEKETTLPAKISISEIKRKHQEEVFGEVLQERKPIELPQKEEKGRLGGARMGTVLHTVLEEADLRKKYTYDMIEDLLQELIARKRLTEQEAKAVYRKGLVTFFESPLAERIRKADILEKEKTFSMLLEPKEAYFGEAYEGITEKILVNGMIDCFFTEADGCVLVDYKTDRVSEEKELIERYQIQLKLYREALERALGMPVKEVYIYSFALGRAILL